MKMSAKMLAAVAVVAVLINPARAEVISLIASGYMTQSTYPGISIGDTFDFYFSYDDTTPDQNPADPAQGHYPDMDRSAFLYINSSLFLTFPASVVIIRDNESISGDMWHGGGAILSPSPIQGVIQLHDESGQAFSSDALVVPVLADYPDESRIALDHFELGYVARGPVTSLTVVAIPEPGTIAMLLLGGAGLFFMRRRRVGRFG